MTIELNDGKGRTLTSDLTDDQAYSLCLNVPAGSKDSDFAKNLCSAFDKMRHRGFRFSPSQRYWMHEVARRWAGQSTCGNCGIESARFYAKCPVCNETKTAPKPQPICVLDAIVKFLEPASKSRKSGACVTFANVMPGHEDLTNNGTVRIKRASAHGKNAGCYWISNGADGRPRGTESEDSPRDEAGALVGTDPVENVLYAKLDAEGGLWKVKGQEIPTGVLATLDELNNDPVSFVMRFGIRTGRCCFCNLPLDDEISVKVGYGPVCAKHYGLPHGKAALAKLEDCEIGKPRKAPEPEPAPVEESTFSLVDATLDGIEKDIAALEARTGMSRAEIEASPVPRIPVKRLSRTAPKLHHSVFASDVEAYRGGYPLTIAHNGREWTRATEKRDAEGELVSYTYRSGEQTLTVFND